MADPDPIVDDRAPADVVTEMVDHVLKVAETWPAWDGRPIMTGDRSFAPHKAIRRVTDHMIDHLAQMEARIAGVESFPDRWHASAITTDTDLVKFTQQDLDEARSRLTRLAQVWALRLNSLTEAQLDSAPAGDWTIRQIAFHVAESRDYADAVGELS